MRRRSSTTRRTSQFDDQGVCKLRWRGKEGGLSIGRSRQAELVLGLAATERAWEITGLSMASLTIPAPVWLSQQTNWETFLH